MAGKFRRFLAESPASTIAVVGHGVFFRELLATSASAPEQGRRTLGNCEIVEILL